MNLEAAVRLLRWILPALLFGAAFLVVGITAAAYNIFMLGEFSEKFGQWGSFHLSAEVQAAIQAVNTISFAITRAAFDLVISCRPRTRVLAMAATVAGVAGGALLCLLHPAIQLVFLGGPLGAAAAYAVSSFQLWRRQPA